MTRMFGRACADGTTGRSDAIARTTAVTSTALRRSTALTIRSLAYTWRMAIRRGVWIVIVLIVFAVFISAFAMLLLATTVAREPSVASNSTLILRVGGDLYETEPGGVFGPF